MRNLLYVMHNKDRIYLQGFNEPTREALRKRLGGKEHIYLTGYDKSFHVSEIFAETKNTKVVGMIVAGIMGIIFGPLGILIGPVIGYFIAMHLDNQANSDADIQPIRVVKSMDVTFETKHRTRSGKDEWLTPPSVLHALGKFDLDPCAPVNRPWDTATKHYTEIDNGLMQNWEGRVWCNPPYGKDTLAWLSKCALHGNATALIFARTDTKMFFEGVWNSATALLFIKGRLNFYNVDGTLPEGRGQSGAPSVLVAFDKGNADILSVSKIPGKFIMLK